MEELYIIIMFFIKILLSQCAESIWKVGDGGPEWIHVVNSISNPAHGNNGTATRHF